MKPFFMSLILGLTFSHFGFSTEKPNVLLLLVDDLKPAIGAFGDPLAKTPNLDKLAASGLRFEKAYCNQAVCAASRYSLFLGSRASTTGLHGLGPTLRSVYPDAVTLPQSFSRHGYTAESLGKTFHIGHGNTGDPTSWTSPPLRDLVIEYREPEQEAKPETREELFFNNTPRGGKSIKEFPRGPAWESPDVLDEAYADGRVAHEAMKRMQGYAETGKPFFLAVGFVRPHLPFSAPKRYWDLYQRDSFSIASNPDLPKGAPKAAGKRGGEITNFSPFPEKPKDEVPKTIQLDLIHGYYASTSYVDAQIGKVLDELARLELDEKTIVVLWGDHGFHLGDLGIWTKHTNYEQANRIPIIIRAPGVTKGNTRTNQPTETVDLYPTLASLAGLPKPDLAPRMDGLDLTPVLKEPSTRVRDHAYHCYIKGKTGRAIRTERYRLVEWTDEKGEQTEYELYDYEKDPLESQNLINSLPKVAKRLKAILANHPPLERGIRKSR